MWSNFRPISIGKQDQVHIALVMKHLNKKNLNYIGYGGYGNQMRMFAY